MDVAQPKWLPGCNKKGLVLKMHELVHTYLYYSVTQCNQEVKSNENCNQNWNLNLTSLRV